MVAEGFKHLRLGMAGNVVLVEIMSSDIQGPDRAKEFIDELTAVVTQEGDGPLLLDLGRARYFSSMGYSALFKMVKSARERQRLYPKLFERKLAGPSRRWCARAVRSTSARSGAASMVRPFHLEDDAQYVGRLFAVLRGT